MKFEVKHRFLDTINFTADIDCDKDQPESKKLGWAIQWAIDNNVNMERSNFDNVDLERADLLFVNFWGCSFKNAFLRSADFQKSDLACSTFENADLRNASFQDVNLNNVFLLGADMRGLVF